MSTLDDALKEAYARSATSTRHLVALAFTMPSPLPNLYLTNYDSDITVSGQLYIGVAMEISEPESGAEPDDKVSVRIDGATGDIQYLINQAIGSGENIPVSMRPFAYNIKATSVIGVVGTYQFLLLKAQYNSREVSLELGHVSPTNQPFPLTKYSPLNSPELYR